MSRREKQSDQGRLCALIFGGVYAVLGFIIRIRVKNPFEMMHILGAEAFLPPLWLFNVLCISWMFLSGYAAGRMTYKVRQGRVGGRQEISAYSGGMFFMALFFLTLLWYPLFFVSGAVWLCNLIALVSLAASVMCSVLWWRADCISSVIMAAGSVWLLYIFLVNLSVSFSV